MIPTWTTFLTLLAGRRPCSGRVYEPFFYSSSMCVWLRAAAAAQQQQQQHNEAIRKWAVDHQPLCTLGRHVFIGVEEQGRLSVPAHVLQVMGVLVGSWSGWLLSLICLFLNHMLTVFEPVTSLISACIPNHHVGLIILINLSALSLLSMHA